MSKLRTEYEGGSRSFVDQIDYLISQGYVSVRRARGDGDCFYRCELQLARPIRLGYCRCVIVLINHGSLFIVALAFAFIDYLLNSPQKIFAVALVKPLLDSTVSMLEDAGFQKLVFEDFYDVLLSLIQQIVIPEPEGTTLTSETLLEAFQNPEGENFSITPRVKWD